MTEQDSVPEANGTGERPNQPSAVKSNAPLWTHLLVVSVLAPIAGGFVLCYSDSTTLLDGRTWEWYDPTRVFGSIVIGILAPLFVFPWCVPVGVLSFHVARGMVEHRVTDPLLWISCGIATGTVCQLLFGVEWLPFKYRAVLEMIIGGGTGAVLQRLWVKARWQFSLRALMVLFLVASLSLSATLVVDDAMNKPSEEEGKDDITEY